MGEQQPQKKPNGAHAQDREWSPSTSPILEIQPSSYDERASASNLRSAFRSPGIRAVTPELEDNPLLDASTLRGLGSSESSPRSIPGGMARRQGIVFNDSYVEAMDSDEGSPPNVPKRPQGNERVRPRTRTMDTSMLAQRSAPPGLDNRHRVSSISSGGTHAVLEGERKPSPASLDAMEFPNVATSRISEFTTPPLPPRDKKSAAGRRLVKRQSSRPTSPVTPIPPSVDCLPFPVLADNAQKVILLMKTLCGKMRGEIEYQGENGGPWYSGTAYIDADKACLMFDSGQNGPFHIPLVSDLRGCRVLPVDYPDAGRACIELVSSSPVVEIVLTPTSADDFDFWLAALLSWQQLRGPGMRASNAKPQSPVVPVRPDLVRRGSSNNGRAPNIIKVGNVQVWDKSHAPTPRALAIRSSTRDVWSPNACWRRVSCILQDNGEFKLLVENEQTVLAVIEMSQLSRSAIQPLNRTVLDEEYCIAIFPEYASSSTQLSVFRPIYLALESRLQFEVWFVLLRTFTVPDNVHRDDLENERIEQVMELTEKTTGEVFRLERSIRLRVTEARLGNRPLPTEAPEMERQRSHRGEHDPLKGNYIAEVIMDDEVRARTTIQTDTKNPFWREDVEFVDLPAKTPDLTVVLKRIEGSAETLSMSQLSLNACYKTTPAQETIYGTTKVPLDKDDEHEDWEPVLDHQSMQVGTMYLKVTHEEHIVLMRKEYEPLSEVLHRFTTGLTTMIAGALPSQLRRLSDLFLNIFQVSGFAGDWLMALVEDEIDGIGNQGTLKKYRFSSRLGSNESNDSNSADRQLMVRDMGKSLAGEANLLFRGNTLLTNSLEFHMRRLGKEYLGSTLQNKIVEINDLNPDCEVDPAKLHSSTELDQHWDRLIRLTTEVWHCIAKSATKLPAELRHILKYIRAVAEDRYGDFLRTVAYTSVSGFLFLRFICPALLSPKLWGLLRDHPRPRAQRTFTLITKALQKLANVSTFGRREEWMEPMNRFLNAQRQSFRDFIDKVCDIPASETSALNLHQAGYSTPMTIVGRLGPVAKEGFPSLPYLIDSTRSYAGLIKLWVDSKPKENAKTAIEGELLVFDELCVSLQERVDSCLAKMAAVRAMQSDDEKSGSDSGVRSELDEVLEAARAIANSNISSPVHAFGGGFDPPVLLDSRPPGSAGSDDHSTSLDSMSRKNRDSRYAGSSKTSALRHVSAATGKEHKEHRKDKDRKKDKDEEKEKNGNKVGRTILSGIMRMGGSSGSGARSVSPDHKEHKKEKR